MDNKVNIPEDILKVSESGEITTKTTTPQLVAYAVHKGSYQEVGNTIQKLVAWMMEKGYAPVGFPSSTYYNDPNTTPEEELLTEIQFPVQKIEE
ncbi:MAG: GyrI-like domain-containing protein [Clostridia bacterium]|nr:GyrI-like domain-containing protein [Clostridia bacterium]